jgi:hypothetical protein
MATGCNGTGSGRLRRRGLLEKHNGLPLAADYYFLIFINLLQFFMAPGQWASPTGDSPQGMIFRIPAHRPFGLSPLHDILSSCLPRTRPPPGRRPGPES